MQAIRTATAATVRQSADIHRLPATTLQTKQQKWLAAESDRLQEQAWEDATCSANLVLGVDDFAIRKGHTYNTGIHNLRGQTLLDIIPGRKWRNFERMPVNIRHFCPYVRKPWSWIWLRTTMLGSRNVFRKRFELQIGFLPPEKQLELKELLDYSPLLRQVYDWNRKALAIGTTVHRMQEQQVSG
ncbi:hypothetical protein B9T62_06855 [Paenibacillus donghaensis]|uniref:Transposase IS204/IS1001/IS1096/IS1165 DDE domain-containing protein n=2 Tax=Paenibacillus donghaensis TaxID=414771 RepID=A0A2Z2K493_9BACL|nr:hypothetical protein B9T62_06855 [Paenibacillus donghaensis]